MDQTAVLILAGFLGIFFIFWLFNYPYLGIVFTIASLPIVDLLPRVPYFSSLVPFVGILTLIAYLIKKRTSTGGAFFKLNSLQITGLLFILWIFISNPQAAWLGGTRNWTLTFAQLWVLLYLAGDLLDEPQKQSTLMLVFSVFAIISAFYAIQTGFIGESFDVSTRAEGFVDGPNAAARYFVVAMVFLTYLRSSTNHPVLRLFTLIGILITYLGVFYTLSRTGILLLFSAQGLILLIQTEGKTRIGLILVFIIGLILLWILSDSIFNIIGTIFPIIIRGEDTMGLRYNLWEAGWMMWKDHPFRGVGIGQYIEHVGPYMLRLEGPRRWRAVTHNTYIHVLSETGIVGFVLFMSIIITSLKNFWQVKSSGDSNQLSLRNTWLIVFVIMLLGGITKSDQADKLSWMIMGLSVFFAEQTSKEKPRVVKQELVAHWHPIPLDETQT